MTDNEVKKSKATKRAVEEVKEREQMEREISALTEEINKLQERKASIERHLSKSSIICDVLTSIRT